MAYGGTIWQMINLVLLKNPTLTAGEGAKIVRDIKLSLKGFEC